MNPEFADAWRTYILETAKHDQLVTENDIYKEVTEYNQGVNADNAEITQKNEALENSMHANNADHIGQVGDINSNLNVSQDVLNVLNSYQSILDLEAQLAEASQALENHAGKNAQLGSDDYAQYLAAVQAYNETVKEYNADVLAYNTAVDTYNAAVKAFNEAQHDTTSSTTGNVTGTGTADWGNMNAFMGGGVSLGIHQSLRGSGFAGKTGANILMGVEFDSNNIPLNFGFDFRPGYGMTFFHGIVIGHFFDWALAASIRYRF